MFGAFEVGFREFQDILEAFLRFSETFKGMVHFQKIWRAFQGDVLKGLMEFHEMQGS